MKKSIFIVAVVFTTIVASAEFIINFTNTGGLQTPTGDGASPSSPLLANIGDSALIQLVYAGANGIADGDVGIGGTAGGDDVVLESWTFSNTGGSLQEQFVGFTYSHQSAFQTGGQLFGRVFENGGAGANTFYFNSAIVVANDLNPAGTPSPTPDTVNVSPGAFSPVATGQVIPEPATIGLLGIAGAGLFAARRKTQA